jgi:NAD+ synthase
MKYQQSGEAHQTIITKPPSAGLWDGQTDQRELAPNYGQIDRYLASGEASAPVKKRLKAKIALSQPKWRPPVAELPGEE